TGHTTLAEGFKLNEDYPMPDLVETPGTSGILAPELPPEGGRIKPPAQEFPIKVPLAKAAAAGDELELRVSVSTFVCDEKSSLCRIRSFIWDLPVKFGPAGAGEPIRLPAETKCPPHAGAAAEFRPRQRPRRCELSARRRCARRSTSGMPRIGESNSRRPGRFVVSPDFTEPGLLALVGST